MKDTHIYTVEVTMIGDEQKNIEKRIRRALRADDVHVSKHQKFEGFENGAEPTTKQK